VDISSTDKDVRIKAEHNMQLYAAKRGILIQTDSTSGNVIEYSGEGETTLTSGIVLKAGDSKVLVYGKYAELFADAMLQLRSLSGQVVIFAAALRMFGNSLYCATKGAIMYLTSKSAALVGKSAILGGDSVNVVRKDRPAKLEFGDGSGNDVVESYVDDIAEPMYTLEQESAEALDVSTVLFKFRSRMEYHTENNFYVYQTPWQLTTTLVTDTWTEKPVNDTFPWPGEEKSNALMYVTLPAPANYSADGRPVPRAEMTKTGGALEAVSPNEYKVVR